MTTIKMSQMNEYLKAYANMILADDRFSAAEAELREQGATEEELDSARRVIDAARKPEGWPNI